MPEGLGSVLDRFDDHVGDGWLAKVERTHGGFVQQSIHGDPGGSRGPGGHPTKLSLQQHPPPHDPVLPLQHNADRLKVSAMLLEQYPCR
jgi:hypothetical protein